MKLTARQYTLAATALGSSLAFIDASAVIVALPTMQKALHLGLAGEQWIFLSYSLALASLYLVGGALGDRFGHQKAFKYGVIGFASASVLAGIAPSGFYIILARVLQGISGAFLTTNSLAWLRSVYKDEAGKAVGLWTSLTGFATIVAPPLGGALTQWLSWRWIFFINLPCAALVLFWTGRSVPDTVDPKVAKPLDPLGALCIAVGFGFLTYYLVQGTKTGFSSLLWCLVIGIIGLVSFGVIEARQKHPMLPLALFKIRNFTMANLETFLIYGALNGLLVYFTLYLQFLGLTPVTSSVFLVPTSIVLILLAAKFGALSDKKGPKLFLTLAPILIGIGALIFSLINNKSDIWTFGVLGVAFFSVGLAMLVAPITSVALKSVPSNFSGIASGVNNTMSRVGGLVSVAVIGLVISLVFVSTTDNKKAVPLALHQTNATLQLGSQKAFQKGAWIIAGLAFGSAAIGAFGIVNPKKPLS